MRLAMVMFNLGAPDRPEAVEPFLQNLFSDPAIIDLPQPLRGWLAKLIAARRGATARAIYAELGGGSPLLQNTRLQAKALEAMLQKKLGAADAVRVVLAMRYWHPFAAEAAEAVRSFAPDELLLLPLYPQFSTTTSGSSLHDWRRAAAAAGLTLPERFLCCYPEAKGFIAESARLIRPILAAAEKEGRPRLLLSAHGLPERIVARGDPYRWQVERSAAAIAAALALPDLDWQVCYQSRVGPLKWIGPATDAEIRRAGAEQRPVVIYPLAFVSEHSETLVELDIEYRKLAETAGVPAYYRIPTVMAGTHFIEALAEASLAALRRGPGIASIDRDRFCPETFGGCPCRQPGRAS